MRILGSIAIHAALLALLALLGRPRAPAVRDATVPIEIVDLSAPVQTASAPSLIDGGGAAAAATVATPTAASRPPERIARRAPSPRPALAPSPSPPATSPWAELDIHVDTDAVNGTGGDKGTGAGQGTGTGDGIGDGAGAGAGRGRGTCPKHRVCVANDLLAITELRAPIPSRARPAKLLHPTRETAVEDAELFVAVVTVDTDGDVVGARMTRSHPGSRGDTAASMIWQFRYSPALDDDGNPTRSTFEQKFAVR